MGLFLQKYLSEKKYFFLLNWFMKDHDQHNMYLQVYDLISNIVITMPDY